MDSSMKHDVIRKRNRIKTPDGEGIVLRHKNGQYVIWVDVELDNGDVKRYDKKELMLLN